MSLTVQGLREKWPHAARAAGSGSGAPGSELVGGRRGPACWLASPQCRLPAAVIVLTVT